jgi:hypothetical protein
MRGPGPDQLALARIAHERDRAAATFVRDRDMVALEEAMARLDEEERAAKVSVPAEPLPPAEIRRYLEQLPEWWAAVGPDDRKALAETLFAKIRVLGLRKAIIEPTFEAAARGLPLRAGPRKDRLPRLALAYLPHGPCLDRRSSPTVAQTLASPEPADSSCPRRALGTEGEGT